VGDAYVFTLPMDYAGYEVVEFFFITESYVGSCARVFSVVDVDGFVYA
jgi:hypothetical protein